MHDDDQRAKQAQHTRALWRLGIRTLDEFKTGAHSITMPALGPLDPDRFRKETLIERTTLAGVFGMLVQAGADDIAGGLRLKLVQEWGPDLVTGGPIPLLAYINWVEQPRLLVPGLPELGMYGWAALHMLVTHGPNTTQMLRLANHTSLPDHQLEQYVTALRDQRIVQDLMQAA